MKRAMTEAAFEEFLAGCMSALREKNAALEKRYRLGSFDRWDHDGDANVLTFSNADGRAIVEAKTTDIGSYSQKSQTWLWAWANQSIVELDRARATPLKQLFDVTGMHLFQDPHFDCDECLAWEMAAAAVHQLQSLGVYRAPIEHLWLFLSIDSIGECEPTA